jgi:hypothetical protein
MMPIGCTTGADIIWQSWCEIDTYVWHICPNCRSLFSDPCMREVYEKRAAEHTRLWEQGIKGPAPGSCPRCSTSKVKGIERVGWRDKWRILVASYRMDIVEWIQKKRKQILVAFS